ncbi:MAG: ShlB/FhaC/HecB family hemolysin secretion/activation protein, partial [Gammaproteobacteria bacterium]
LPGGATPGGAHPQAGGLPTVPPTSLPPFPIPPVIQRPLGLTQGPKVQVRSFKLEGLADHPRAGIRSQDIKALAARALGAHAAGFTIGQLQQVANDITRYYRKRGFILAQAFVPVQTVSKGIVLIRVLEGDLGGVVPEGNKMYSGYLLGWPFEDLVGKPVQKSQIDSALLRLTDYPGLTAFGVFRPGQKVGTTELVVKTLQEQRVDGNVSLDNYGTSFTGQYRLRGSISINNPTGIADRLTLAVLQTASPADGTYGALRYDRPLLIPSLATGFNLSRNSFSVGQQLAALDVTGVTDIASGYLKESFVRSRLFNLYGQLEFSRKRAVIRQAGTTIGQEDLSVLSGELDFNSIDTRFHGINQGSVVFSHGLPGFLGAMGPEGSALSSRIGGSGKRAGGQFNKVAVHLSRLQHVTSNQSILARLDAQYSSDLLSSLEQMPLGGPTSVRAYPVAEFLRDKAAFASLQWNVNAPGFADKPAFDNRTWGQLLQFSAFFDYGVGAINDPLPGEVNRVTLKGAGVGCQFVIPGKLLATLDVATRIGGRAPSNGRTPQYWFNMSYQF